MRTYTLAVITVAALFITAAFALENKCSFKKEIAKSDTEIDKVGMIKG